MSDIHNLTKPAQISREGFEMYVQTKYGLTDDQLAIVAMTFKPCDCSSDICQGWTLDSNVLMRVIA